MTSNTQAILICLLAYICFDLMAVHVRVLSEGYSPQELSVYRNILGVIPTVALLAYTKELRFEFALYKIKQWKLALLRGIFVAIAQLLFYTALANLELATVSALGQTNATFVVLIAIIIYKEHVGIWRWSAIAIGFIGALIIVNPGSEVFTWTALLPIGAAFCYACSMVTLRSFDKSISSAVLYLYSATSAAIGALIIAYVTIDLSPIHSIKDGILIFSMSMFGGFGVIFLMYAFRNAPAAVLAPFSYFGIITSFCFGWFIFGEFPIKTLFPGVLFIILSGLIIIWREQR